MAKKILKLIRDYYLVIRNAPKNKLSKYEFDLINNLTEKNILFKPLSSLSEDEELKKFKNYLNFKIPFYQMILKLKKEDLENQKQKYNFSEISENLTISTIIKKFKTEIKLVDSESEKINTEKKDKKQKNFEINNPIKELKSEENSQKQKKPNKDENSQKQKKTEKAENSQKQKKSNKNSKEENPLKKSGNYHMENGKLKEGKPKERESTLFSNWNASNCDPDEFNKHKELLDRQHFRGPFWEDKTIPKSVEEEMPHYKPMRGDYNPNSEAVLKKQKETKREFKFIKR